MKLFQLFILTFLYVGCNSNIKNEPKEIELKKNQFVGKIIYKERERLSKTSAPTKKEIYLNMNEKDYFIKISEGYMSEDKLLKHENQIIKIKGEIKNGEWEHQEPVGLNNLNPPKARSGEYIVIYRIFNK